MGIVFDVSIVMSGGGGKEIVSVSTSSRQPHTICERTRRGAAEDSMLEEAEYVQPGKTLPPGWMMRELARMRATANRHSSHKA